MTPDATASRVPNGLISERSSVKFEANDARYRRSHRTEPPVGVGDAVVLRA